MFALHQKSPRIEYVELHDRGSRACSSLGSSIAGPRRKALCHGRLWHNSNEDAKRVALSRQKFKRCHYSVACRRWGKCVGLGNSAPCPRRPEIRCAAKFRGIRVCATPLARVGQLNFIANSSRRAMRRIRAWYKGLREAVLCDRDAAGCGRPCQFHRLGRSVSTVMLTDASMMTVGSPTLSRR